MFANTLKYKPSTSQVPEAGREIPVTIVTGFLGSGKTTLLNRLLKENHGKKIAVILNEIGEVNLDSELVVQSQEELKVMNNGCLCCTVRGDLSRIAKDLITKGLPFDYMVIETTGMADPSPVAQTFFMEEDIQRHYFLDSIVTVVDALYIDRNLEEIKETQDQIGFADVIVLNKTDLVDESRLKELEGKIRDINSQAKMLKTSHCNVPVTEILDIGAFNLDNKLEIYPDLKSQYHEHTHDEAIQSIYLEEKQPLNLEKLDRFLSLISSELGSQILRSKGVLNIEGEDQRIVFQGIHMTMGSSPDRPWNAGEERKTQMVFIGRHLPKDVLIEGLSLCIAK
jgi:G3E family GTPase